jgi:hypothetical protein
MSIFSAPSFYAPVDRGFYDQGFTALPQSKFTFGINLNQNQTTDDSGIATLPIASPRTIRTGGGGTPFTGGVGDLKTAFQKAVDDRQTRLTELNRPMGVIPGQTGDEIIMERLAPFDAPKDYYKGSIEGIPQTIKGAPGIFEREEPTIGRKLSEAFYSLPFTPNKPQTAEMIMEQGYTGRAGGPGIIGMVLGSMDKFGSLSRPDQAFIQANMGYTGPTVFGENTSGGNKDPFGLNVRSGFGNYAERVGVEAEKLTDALSGRLTDKYGKGLTDEEFSYDPITGQYVGTNAAAVAKANQMTKMMRAKQLFYSSKTKERDDLRRQEKERQAAELAAARARAQREIAARGYQDYGSGGGRDESLNTGPGGSYSGRGDQGATGANFSGDFATDSASYDLAEGGRVGYMGGGLTDLVDIYD